MPRNPVRWGLGLVGLGEQVGPRREAPCGGLVRSRSLPGGAQHGMGAEGPLQHPVRGSLPIPLRSVDERLPPPSLSSSFLLESWEVQGGIFVLGFGRQDQSYQCALPASSEVKLKMGGHRCQVARGHLPIFFFFFNFFKTDF